MDTSQPNKPMLNEMMCGFWMTQGIYVAAELGIADRLAGGPCAVEELAKITNTDSDALFRVLRALASVGIFAQDAEGRFVLTPMAERLISDVEGTQRSFAIMAGSEFYETWGNLLHTVKTGEPGFQKRYGVPFFQYMTDNPERHGIYDAAMNGVHGPETVPMMGAYDFSKFRSLVDIGGGNGQTLATILDRHSEIKGTLFDLPAVADRARRHLPHKRMEIVGGNFFVSVPEGADAYLMRHILHDWLDDDAVAILTKCREAMAPDGKVLVVESVIPPGNEPSLGKWLDLMMLLVSGRERTEEQYRDLFSRAGLRLTRVVPTASPVQVVEGVRTD